MKPHTVFYQQFSLPYFGILSLIGNLQHEGYASDVVVAALEKDPESAVAAAKPDIVGISVMTVEHRWLARTVPILRRLLPDALIIVGGIHAVLYPEEVLAVPGIDLVCTSDGEEVMAHIARAFPFRDGAWSSLRGIGYRGSDGAIVLNERAQLFDYAGAWVEDRSVYYRRYPLLARDTAKRFISSRGCPYKCNFCYNERLRDIFQHSGTYVRRKAPAALIEEIKRVTGSHRTESVFFVDDLFTMDKEWMRQFLALYRKQIAIPFVCTTRANILDEERAALLAAAGCRTVSFGVESGREEIRKVVLNKDITDEAIVRCGRTLKTHGMHVQTANMFCLPGETLEDAFRTIELNIEAGTDYAFASLLMPFPKTAIAEYCIAHGYLRPDYSIKDLPDSFLTASILMNSDKDAIMNVQRLSYLFIRHPFLYRRFRRIVRARSLTWLFKVLFVLSNFLRHKEERGVSFVSAFQYAWRMRKTF